MKSMFILLIIVLSMNNGWSQTFSWVSSNRVDEHLIVHTIQLHKSKSFESISDTEVHGTDDKVTHEINNQLKSMGGVIRSTFDRATHTFTILSNDDIVDDDVSKVIEQFNFKMDEKK